MNNDSGKKYKISPFKRGSTLLRVIAFVTVMAVILAIMIFARRNTKGIVTSYVTYGSIKETVESETYFIREEYSQKAGHTGVFMPVAGEGSRVSKGETLAYIVSDGAEETFNKLRSAERKLNAALKASYIYSGAFPDSYINEDYEIRKNVLSEGTEAERGYLGSYVDIKEKTDASLREMNDSEDFGEGDEYAEKLKKDVADLKSQLSGKIFEIKADRAGTVSFYTDGTEKGTTDIYLALEECRSTGNYKTFDGGSRKNIKDMQNLAGKTVSSEDTVLRIMPQIYCYLITDHDGKAADKIYFTSDENDAEGNARYLATEKGHLIALSAVGLASFSDMSRGKLTLTLSDTSGMKVPVNCLTEWDAPEITARIAIVRSGIVEYVHVQVLAKDKEYAVIASHSLYDDTGTKVRLNDIFVVNYRSVYEGQVM